MYTSVPLSYRCFISNLALIDQTVSEKMIFYIMITYMYIAPGIRVGQISPWCPNFYQNFKLSVYLPISFKFSPSNDILTIFPIQMHGQPMYIDITIK